MATEQQPVSIEQLSHVTLVVGDQEEALAWFTDVLGFEKRADEPFEVPSGESGRWLTVAPADDDVEISLISPDADLYDEENLADLNKKLGTDTRWTFRTDDCRETVEALRERGATITGDPVEYPWGISAMIADPFGNEFNLMEMSQQ